MLSSDSMRRCLALAVAVPLFGAIAGAAEPSPDDLLKAYAESCKAYEHAAYRAEVKVTYDGPKLPAGTVTLEADYRVWRDGERWKFLVAETRRFVEKGVLRQQEHQEEWLYPGKGFLLVRKNPAERPPPWLRHFISAGFDEVPGWQRSKVYPNHLGVLYGRLHNNMHANNYVPLPRVLGQSRLSAREGEVEGKWVWVLEASGAWGSHALSLDPEAGYLPRRIEQRKDGADWIEQGKRVDSFPPSPGNLYFPAGRLTGRTLVLDAVRIERIGGRHLLTGFTVRETGRYEDAPSVALTAEVRLRDIRLRPDFSDNPFRITTALQNGTPVSVVGEQGAAYEWRDGKIKKRSKP